jgi:VCBS repeat-containing protein
VAAGGFHTVGLKSDGTAVAAGLLSDGQCDVSGWSGIVEVAGGDKHSVGLKSDGTVVAAGLDSSGQCGVSEWSDVTAVTTGDNHTVGLKSNGTVVAVGANGDGQLGVSGWSDIVAIAAGQAHTVGLKSDGTAVAVGNNANGQCNVSEWSDIVAVAAGGDHTLGLKSDGTVVAVGRNLDSECEVSGWSGVVALTAGRDFTLGLKSDGTVVAVGNNVSGQCNVSGWSETTVISAGLAYAVGLKSDGTVLAVGEGSYGQLGCTSWTSIPLGSRHGAIGGAGSAVGLRAHVPSGLGGWTKLDSATSALRPGEAVKFAVRLSADGVNWSGPLGHDGQPIDWTNQTGNYLGRAVSDAGSRVDLSQLQALPYIDIVVRIESAGVVSPVVKSAVLEYQVNEAPIAIADVYSVAEDSTLTRVAPGVLGNDTDPEGGTLTAIKGSGPEHGTLTLDADGSFIYTPHADWYGTDTFTYKANDGSMYSNPATVTITVNPVIDPSTITVTSVSKTLSAPGAYYTFSGTLGSGGTAVAGRRVVLQSAGSAAGPWANTAVFTQTAADGRFALRIKPLNKTYYRASFAGDVDFSACLSSARFATPKVSLGAPVAPKTMRRSKVYTVYGSLKPKHTAGTKPVRIYRERKVAGKWKKFGYVRATAYTYKGYSRYKVKMGLTTRGSWRLRAYAPADSRHAATWSSKYDYVRVE